MRMFSLVLLVVCATFFFSASAPAAEWHFPVGLTYASNFDEIKDIHEENLIFLGYSIYDVGTFPVGIAFHPYMQFDSGFGIGGTLGPIMVITGDVDYTDVPINVDARYSFSPKASSSPYVRAGIRYHITSGDYDEGSSPGFFGGVGVEFMKDRMIGAGIEVAIDTSEVEIRRLTTGTNETIKPTDLMISVYALF